MGKRVMSQTQCLQKCFKSATILKQKRKQQLPKGEKGDRSVSGEQKCPLGVTYILNKWVSREEESTGLQACPGLFSGSSQGA